MAEIKIFDQEDVNNFHFHKSEMNRISSYIVHNYQAAVLYTFIAIFYP